MNIFAKFAAKSLSKNRGRTVICLVGIILASAMITAVMSGISSLYSYLAEITRIEYGSWHSSAFPLNNEEIQKLRSGDKTGKSGASSELNYDKLGLFSDLGYAKLPRITQKETPYLFLADYEGDLPELLSVRLIDGRLPKNDTELLVPKSLETRGEISYTVGQKISLETGQRIYTEDGASDIVWQDFPYEGEETETFQADGTKTYTVVGIYDSANLGYWGMDFGPGYVALTTGSPDSSIRRSMAYVEWDAASEEAANSKRLKALLGEDKILNTNSRYVQILTYRADSTAFQTLWILAVLLLAVIVLSAVILIYNSFAISINERKKQFGLLSSLGATKRQLRQTILTEAALVCTVGIPLGVLLGIGGLTATLAILQRNLSELLSAEPVATLHLSAAPWAIIAALALSSLTVLVSTYIPARRALRVSAIEAIRQSAEASYSPKKLRTSGLVRRLFGLEGEIAVKNYKRSKSKYRTTVFSIFISLVLFISANSFCSYLSDSIRAVISNYQCDIWLDADGVTAGEQTEELYARLAGSDGVTSGEYHYTFLGTAIVPTDAVSNHFYQKNTGEPKPENPAPETLCDQIGLIFLQDEAYNSFVRSHCSSPSEYTESSSPKALVYDTAVLYDPQKKHYTVSNFLETPLDSLTQIFSTDRHTVIEDREYCLDDTFLYINRTSDGEYEAMVFPIDTEGSTNTDEVNENEKWVPLNHVCDVRELALGEMIDTLPPGIDHEAYYMDLTLIYPERALSSVVPNPERAETFMTFKSENHEKSYSEMEMTLQASDAFDAMNLYNVAETEETNRAYILVVRVFTYSFLILIFLTSTVNIINVISANVLLRRREFAMLRSVGMTRAGFLKMSAFESLLFGSKGVLLGLPAAIALSAVLWYFFVDTVEFPFYVSRVSVTVAIGAVFIVIGGTMLYSVHRIWRDNVIDSLRLE